MRNALYNRINSCYNILKQNHKNYSNVMYFESAFTSASFD